MRTRTLAGAAALTLAAAALPPAVASGGPPSEADPQAHARARASATHTVALHELRFHPATLTIKRGDSVRWVWRDPGTEHNVTFRSSHSRTQESGSYTLKFTRAGSFSYRCTIHESEGMRGKVVVH